MSEKTLLYSHFAHVVAFDADPVIIMPPQALMRGWLTNVDGPPAASPQAELAALDMALACLYEQVEDYFLTNAFADRLTAAAELLAAARAEDDDLTVQRLAGELTAALTAANDACRAASLLQTAEEQPPLD